MKNNRHRALPHPLLSPLSTDVQPNTFEFQCAAGDITCDRDAWHIGGQIHHECRELINLVAGGAATLGLHIECPRTFYRAWFPQSGQAVSVNLPRDSVRGRVELLAVCVAAREIPEYRLAGQHEDYGKTTFAIVPGDMLAVASHVEFDAYPDIDPIRKISSILNISRVADMASGPARIVFDGDRITVELSDTDYQNYVQLRVDPSRRGILAANVVLPAILQAVNYLGQLDDDDLENAKASRRWCRSLCARLDRAKISPKDGADKVFTAVQEILQGPIHRGIADLIAEASLSQE